MIKAKVGDVALLGDERVLVIGISGDKVSVYRRYFGGAINTDYPLNVTTFDVSDLVVISTLRLDLSD